MTSLETNLFPVFDKLFSCARALSKESFDIRKAKVEAFAINISSPDGIQAVYNHLSAETRLSAAISDHKAISMKERSKLFPSLDPVEIENMRANSVSHISELKDFSVSVKPAYDRFLKDVRHFSREVGKELFMEDYNERQQMLVIGRMANLIASGDRDTIDRVSKLSEGGLKELVRRETAKPTLPSSLNKDIPFFKEKSFGGMDYVKQSFSAAEAGKVNPPQFKTVFRDLISKAVEKSPFGVRDNHFQDRPDPVTGRYLPTARARIVNTIASALDNPNIDRVELSFHDFSKNKDIANVPNLYRTIKESERDPAIQKVFQNLPETLYRYSVAAIGQDVVLRENTKGRDGPAPKQLSDEFADRVPLRRKKSRQMSLSLSR